LVGSALPLVAVTAARNEPAPESFLLVTTTSSAAAICGKAGRPTSALVTNSARRSDTRLVDASSPILCPMNSRPTLIPRRLFGHPAAFPNLAHPSFAIDPSGVRAFTSRFTEGFRPGAMVAEVELAENQGVVLSRQHYYTHELRGTPSLKNPLGKSCGSSAAYIPTACSPTTTEARLPTSHPEITVNE
jgi:hypothetical protein